MSSAINWTAIDKVIAGFEPRSLLGLLAAAADSPAGSHRLPSIELLWIRTLQLLPDGARLAEPRMMRRVLDAAHKACPALKQMEDWWPPDPRLEVRFPTGPTRLAIHPGLRTNPIAVLRTAADVARAVDPTLSRRLGFGLSDVIEVALRYSDWRLDQLRRFWPKGRLPRDARAPRGEDLRGRVNRIQFAPVTLTKTEVAASTRLLHSVPSWLGDCSDQRRAKAAWKYLQKSPSAIDYRLAADLPSAFGSVVAAQTALGDVLFPAAYVLDAVLNAMVEMADRASRNRVSLGRLHELTYARILRRFEREPPPPIKLPRRHNARQGVGQFDGFVIVDGRRAFVFATVVALSKTKLAKELERRERALLRVTADTITKAHPKFGTDGEVYRILLVGGPFHPGWRPAYPILRIHIEELTDMMLDADQGSRIEDPDVVSFWQFVLEWSRGISVSVVPFETAEDAWQLWIRVGAFDLTGTDEIGIFVDPVPSPSRWEWSAAWELFDSKLAASHLPPHWEWIHSALEPNFAGAELWMGHLSALVSGPLSLVVVSQINPKLAALSIDPALPVVLVADGVFLTFRNYRDLFDLLQIPSGVALTVFIDLSAEPAPGSNEDAVGVGVSARDQTMKVILGADWIELLIADASSAHSLLGRGIAKGLAELGVLAPDRQGQFVETWDATPPVGLIHLRPGALPVPKRGVLDLPIGRSTAATANRLLARFVAKTGARSGSYTGRLAIQTFNKIIAPALQEALAHVVRQWSSSSTFEVARKLNEAHAERFRWETELEQALSAPWSGTWREKALSSRDPATVTRPMEHLMELVQRESPHGRIMPDRYDIAGATHVVSMALEVMLLASAAESRIHNLLVAIGPGGLLHVQAVKRESRSKVAPRVVNFEAFKDAFQEDRLKDRADDRSWPQEVMLDADHRVGDAKFMRIEEAALPQSFMDADEALKGAFGTGTNGITAILGTAINWSGYDDSVKVAQAEEVIALAQSWSGLDITEVTAAFELLVIDGKLLRSEPFRFWEQQRRKQRLATQPLMRLTSGQILIMPRMIQHTQSIFAAYLLDGLLPWSPARVPAVVRDAFIRYRQTVNKQLQREAVAAIIKLGLSYKEKVEPSHVAPLGIALSGEVDLLVADSERHRLWVCEVKDQSPGSSPSTIAIRIEKFLAPDGYVDRLTAKVREIRSSVGAALAFIGLTVDSSPNWEIVPLMITRRVEPAAFARSMPLKFTTIDQLAATMRS